MTPTLLLMALAVSPSPSAPRMPAAVTLEPRQLLRSARLSYLDEAARPGVALDEGEYDPLDRQLGQLFWGTVDALGFALVGGAAGYGTGTAWGMYREGMTADLAYEKRALPGMLIGALIAVPIGAALGVQLAGNAAGVRSWVGATVFGAVLGTVVAPLALLFGPAGWVAVVVLPAIGAMIGFEQAIQRRPDGSPALAFRF